MLKRILPLLVLLPWVAMGQQTNYLSVLDQPSSARAAGLGMDYLALWDDDPWTAFDNPSFISERSRNRLLFNYESMFAGAHFGSAAYGMHFNRLGDFLFGLKFNSYGIFDGYDEAENATGHFFAADYVFSIGWGRHIDSCFSIGAALKPAVSQYAHYSAFAIALDVAGSYTSPSRRFSATLMGRNIGAQLATFDGTVEHLPFELSAALSYKLENAPFRLFFAATELQRWNLRYPDPLNPVSTYDPYTDQWSEEGFIHKAADLTFRHAVFGVELSIRNLFFARVGYNYRKSVENHGTLNINTSGFSYGFGLRMKKFEFSFARNNYYLGKAPNYLSVALRL